MAKKSKVERVMGEFKEGKLRSGSKKGPKVKNRKQAVAIALSEAGKSNKQKAAPKMGRKRSMKDMSVAEIESRYGNKRI